MVMKTHARAASTQRRVMRITVAAFATIAVAGTIPAQTSTADAAYNRSAKAWSLQKTLEAKFEQRITNPLLGRTLTSRGTFLQQRPGRVSITFSDPTGDRIVGDGKWLWVYLPSSTPGQVLKLPADADGAMVADLLGALLDAPSKTFIISGGDAVVIDGRATHRVVLVPRVAGSTPFQKATLWLDDKAPRPVRVQVLDGQGVDRTIVLTSWTPDVVLPANAFTFSPPKGVKVVTKLPGMD